MKADSAGVFKDEHEFDSGKRYKMFFRDEKEKAMAIAFSAGGINWTAPQLDDQNMIKPLKVIPIIMFYGILPLKSMSDLPVPGVKAGIKARGLLAGQKVLIL